MIKITKEDQKRIICEVLDGVKETLTREEYLNRIPEEWDGYEIRQLVVDHVNENCIWQEMGRTRKREYKEDRLVRNL